MATCLYWLKNIKLKATIQVLNVSSFNTITVICHHWPQWFLLLWSFKTKTSSSFVMIPCVFYASSPFCELAFVFSSSSSCSLQSTHTYTNSLHIIFYIILNSSKKNKKCCGTSNKLQQFIFLFKLNKNEKAKSNWLWKLKGKSNVKQFANLFTPDDELLLLLLLLLSSLEVDVSLLRRCRLALRELWPLLLCRRLWSTPESELDSLESDDSDDEEESLWRDRFLLPVKKRKKKPSWIPTLQLRWTVCK